MTNYTYSITTDFPNGFDGGVLHLEILNSAITIAIDGVSTSGDVIIITFKSALTAPDLTVLGTIIAAHTGIANTETTQLNTNNQGQDIVEINQPYFIPRIIDMQAGDTVNPVGIDIPTKDVPVELANISGPGNLHFIIINGNRDDYYLSIIIDNVETKLHCEYLRNATGLNVDILEDMSPQILARTPGVVVFNPKHKWYFKESLIINITKDKPQNIKVFGMMEYAI